jgi:hypothetical protein
MSGRGASKLQHYIMTVYALAERRRAAATWSAEERARFNSASAKHASSWLTVLLTEPRFWLSDQQTSIAFRLRLGLTPQQGSRVFNEIARVRGNVGFSLNVRHDRVKEALATLCRSVSALTQREPVVRADTRADLLLFLSQMPGIQMRW